MNIPNYKEYLKHMLRADLENQAPQIVAYRNGIFAETPSSQAAPPRPIRRDAGVPERREPHTPAPASPSLDEQVSQAREQAEAALERIREDFWQLPDTAVNTMLGQIDLKTLPDLTASVRRLNHCNQNRAAFAQLAMTKDVDVELLDDIRRVALMSPTAASAERERILHAVAGGRHGKATSKMLNQIKWNLPSIYQLETVWIDELFRVVAGQLQLEESPERSKEVPIWIWVVLALVIRAIFQMMRS